MRIGLAALVWWETDWILKEAYQGTPPNPEGLAHLPGAAWFAQPAVGAAMMWVSLAGLILFALGRAPVLALLPALFGNLMIGSLKNSQGAINHSGQLLSMVLLTAWLLYLWAAWSDRRGHAGNPGSTAGGWWHPGLIRERLVVHWIKVTIAASYVVCALQKWIDSDLQWIWRTPWLAVQIIKNNRAEYFSKLEQPAGWIAVELPNLILQHPHVARVVFGSGLLLETFAFLALCGRRWAAGYGLALIGLHLSISVVMALNFDLHMWLILIFLVNVPGWLLPGSRAGTDHPACEAQLWPSWRPGA